MNKAPEWYAKVAVGRIKGKPDINLSREVVLTFTRSIFESCFIIDDAYYHDIGMAAYFVNQNDKTAGINFACPGCGRVTSINFTKFDNHDTWKWNNDMNKPSALPSIAHNQQKGGCGWHGFLAYGRLQKQAPAPWGVQVS